MDIDKYDEYVPGVAREVITVDTKIKDTNKGFAMLSKLGWKEGQPLGLSGDGASVHFYQNQVSDDTIARSRSLAQAVLNPSLSTLNVT